MKVICCDNGTAFRSGAMKEACDQMNVSINFSAPYSPKTNGAIERTHGPLKRTLLRRIIDVCYQRGRKLRYDELQNVLDDVVICLTNCKSSATGLVPSILFEAFVSREVLHQIYLRHARRHLHSTGAKQLLAIGNNEQLQEFQELYGPFFKALEKHIDRSVSYYVNEKQAYLDDRHRIKGDCLLKLTKYQYFRHEKNRRPSGTADVFIKGSNSTTYLVRYGTDLFYARIDDDLLRIKQIPN